MKGVSDFVVVYDISCDKERRRVGKIKTGFVKLYRLEYSWKSCVIGKPEKKSIDDDSAYII